MEAPPYGELVWRVASFIPISNCFLALSSLFSLPFLLHYSHAALFLLREAIEANKPEGEDSALLLLLKALFLLPASYYYLAFFLISLATFYNLMESHLLRDLLTGFRGGAVTLTFHPRSRVGSSIISKCRILHERYVATPWLASPHLQTAFMSLFGSPPPLVCYEREVFRTTDGGTIALDWLRSSKVLGSESSSSFMHQDGRTPIAIVIPGLGSESVSPFIKHLALTMAKRGWNVCVSNHRGYGGVPITSDRVCNGGLSEDSRQVINHLHHQYQDAPLYVVGTSVGANILVKYLGEEGVNAPISGAAAVCCPWDLLEFDRFLNRRFMQKIYDMAITIALQIHADKHKSVFSRLGDWEGIKKSRSVRDFYHCGTGLMGNFKTVDTYYRHCSSVNFIENVAVPLLCISALDDPVCSKDAIPWDECRANENVVLATTHHGGHIAHYEGITAKSMWWVRAVGEFLDVLHSTQVIPEMRTMQRLTLPSASDNSLHGDLKATEKKQPEHINANSPTDAVRGAFLTEQRAESTNDAEDPLKSMQGSEIDLRICIFCNFKGLVGGCISFSATCVRRLLKRVNRSVYQNRKSACSVKAL